ncbi:serine carboxypeptidase-like 45 isoform X2 [Fagus crenata]
MDMGSNINSISNASSQESNRCGVKCFKCGEVGHKAADCKKPMLSRGPGCSSVGGAFLEHGPFKVSGDSLVRNDYNWNKEANMLYLESPAGVGYSANKSFYTYVNDEITARDNLLFLQRWFAKFPEYRSRDFFIAGVSYGGHYVPQLAQLIIQSNVKINLKGIAVGNPLLDFTTDFNSGDEYYWSHGLISDVMYQLLTKVCNGSERMRNTLINGGRSLSCNNVSSQLNKVLIDSIDIYNVIGDVCRTSQLQTKEIICGQVITENYFNRKDVQKALHAQLLGLDQWSLCTDPSVLRYDLKNLEIPTIGVVGSLVKSGIRVLVYSGDQDAVIPFTSSRRLVDRLAKELGLKTTVPYRAWFEGKQVGGWTQIYGKTQLSFASIRGGSHFAPLTQPARSFLLFKAFLAGKPLPNA